MPLKIEIPYSQIWESPKNLECTLAYFVDVKRPFHKIFRESKRLNRFPPAFTVGFLRSYPMEGTT